MPYRAKKSTKRVPHIVTHSVEQHSDRTQHSASRDISPHFSPGGEKCGLALPCTLESEVYGARIEFVPNSAALHLGFK